MRAPFILGQLFFQFLSSAATLSRPFKPPPYAYAQVANLRNRRAISIEFNVPRRYNKKFDAFNSQLVSKSFE